MTRLTHHQTKHEQRPWAILVFDKVRHVLRGVWPEIHLRLAWPQGHQCKVCGVYRWQEGPYSVHLRDVPGYNREHIGRYSRRDAEFYWILQRGVYGGVQLREGLERHDGGWEQKGVVT